MTLPLYPSTPLIRQSRAYKDKVIAYWEARARLAIGMVRRTHMCGACPSCRKDARESLDAIGPLPGEP